MSARAYTAAIVGCGDIAHYHLQGYRLAGVEVIACVDPLQVARDQFVAEYGLPSAFPSLAAMFARVKPDLVSVCAWHLLHAPLTVEAAAGGVRGILCEKPMAVGLGAADRMLAACEAAGVKLVISHQRRYTLGWEKGRQLVAAGALGAVEFAVSKIEQGLLNCGTHAIDGVRFVLGDPEPAWVMGAVERRTDRHERDTPIEDGCMGLVHFEGGVQLYLQCDLDLHRTHVGRFFLRGEDGMMEVSETSCRTLGGGDGSWRTHDLGVPAEQIDVIGGRANARQVLELIDWIEGRRDGHRGAGRSGRVTVEIMMALQESARRHRAVHLPLQEPGYPLERMVAEGRLPVEVPGRYDIRAFLKRDDIDEAGYEALRATGMGHHQIMRTLHERRQEGQGR